MRNDYAIATEHCLKPTLVLEFSKGELAAVIEHVRVGGIQPERLGDFLRILG